MLATKKCILLSKDALYTAQTTIELESLVQSIERPHHGDHGAFSRLAVFARRVLFAPNSERLSSPQNFYLVAVRHYGKSSTIDQTLEQVITLTMGF